MSVRLDDIFNVNYGTKQDMNKMSSSADSSIAFVSRSSKNNGIVNYVDIVDGVKAVPAGAITVTLGGTYVLSSFLQETPFYTGQNVAVLTPKFELTKEQKLYYCMCITKNRYKYSAFGREANRTLKSLKVPHFNEFPTWVNDADLSKFDGVDKPKNSITIELPKFTKMIKVDDLFKVVNGITATGLVESENQHNNNVMYVRPASTQARTFRSYIDKSLVSDKKIFPKDTLFVSTNGEGSHSYSYVSTCEFVPNSDVSVLIPKYHMSIEEKIFYSKCITANRYLFSYGRKPKGNKLKSIKLPYLCNEDKIKVQNFINSLAYSSNI